MFWFGPDGNQLAFDFLHTPVSLQHFLWSHAGFGGFRLRSGGILWNASFATILSFSRPLNWVEFAWRQSVRSCFAILFHEAIDIVRRVSASSFPHVTTFEAIDKRVSLYLHRPVVVLKGFINAL